MGGVDHEYQAYKLAVVDGIIVNAGGASPIEMRVDSSGTVRWINLTENYWVRARPEQVLEVAKLLDR